MYILRKSLILFFCLISLAYAANPNDLAKLSKVDNSNPNIGLDLSNADLRTYQFAGTKIDLKNANLMHANLTNVNLEKMDLRGANLSYANLTNTNLKGADLSNASLKYAILVGANLMEANLNKADFTCANFNNSNLTKANFAETNISSATFANTITTDILNYDSVLDEHVTCMH